MDNAMQGAIRRPKRRPPLRSYVPFALFVSVCLILVVAIFWLLVRVVSGSGNASAPVPSATRSSLSAPAPTSMPSASASKGGETPVGSLLTVSTEHRPTSNLSPTPRASASPVATLAPAGHATIVVARNVNNHQPIEAAARFVSPAKKLWAIVTVDRASATDILRFVFQRNGQTLKHDDVSYQAGTGGTNQVFSAYADYQNGAKPLPVGKYRVLFYRNGRLEGSTSFRIG